MPVDQPVVPSLGGGEFGQQRADRAGLVVDAELGGANPVAVPGAKHLVVGEQSTDDAAAVAGGAERAGPLRVVPPAFPVWRRVA